MDITKKRSVYAKFESLVKRDVYFRGKRSIITSYNYRNDKVFFSLCTENMSYDFVKTIDELEIFLNRLVEISKVIVQAKVLITRKRRMKNVYNVSIWKDKGKPHYIVFGEDVAELPFFDKYRRLSLGIPIVQEELQNGTLYLLPSDKGRAVRRRGRYLIYNCISFCEYVKVNSYDVAVGLYGDKTCLILKPII